MNRAQKSTAVLAVVVAAWAGAIALPTYFGQQAYAATDAAFVQVAGQ